jgi:hypothetical protein
MATKVLLIGATGVFGARIARVSRTMRDLR